MNTPNVQTPSIEEQPWRVFRHRKGVELVNLKELWRYRDLLWLLAIRDLQVRYRNTVIGVAWVILQPLSTMVLFGILFAAMKANATTEGVPYFAVAYCGILPWQAFAFAVNHGANSLTGQQNIISKVYFPRLILPLAPNLCAAMDFAIASSLLIPIFWGFGVMPGWQIVYLPMYLLLLFVCCVAISIWMAAVNAIYRDMQYLLPFLMQIGFFASPVVYETTRVVPERWRWVYALNPMSTVIDGIRWSLMGTGSGPGGAQVLSLLATVALLISGIAYFRRQERSLADRL